MGHFVAFTYDALGRTLTVTSPDPDGGGSQTASVTTNAFDAASRLTSVTDPLSHVTTYGYDFFDNRTSITQHDPDGGGSLQAPVTTFTFDNAGNMLTLTDPVDNVTTWTYDALNRVTEETNQLSDSRTFAYDAMGNLLSKTDRLGRETEFLYDNLYRLLEENWYNGTTLVRTIEFSYDANSRLTEATDPSATLGFTYDNLGRVTSESQSFAGFSPLLTYDREYNAASSVTEIAATIGSTADFLNTLTYDNLQRTTQLTQQDQSGGNAVADKRIDFTYDASGAFTKITRYASLDTSEHVISSHYAYDGMGRLDRLTHSTSTTAPSSGFGSNALAGYAFTYDAASRITGIDSYADSTTAFTYDNTNQLTAADHTGQTDETYSFDENGNRTMSGYDIDPNNQLASDGTYNYTYDDEGNRLTKTKISNGDKEEYTWDHRNRLVTITFKNSGGTVVKTVDQLYDVFNQWIKRSIDPDGATGSAALVDSYFSLLDGQVVAQFDGSSASDLTNRTLWNPAAIDQIMADEAVTSLSSAGTILWPFTDHLGTTRDLASYNASTNATTISSHRRFDAFGVMVSESNSSYQILFGFTGRPSDDSTDLQNNLNRWYAFGIWLNEDPSGLGSDPNAYRYVGNSPNLCADPLGLQRRLPDTALGVDWDAAGGLLASPMFSIRNGLSFTLNFHTERSPNFIGLFFYQYNKSEYTFYDKDDKVVGVIQAIIHDVKAVTKDEKEVRDVNTTPLTAWAEMIGKDSGKEVCKVVEKTTKVFAFGKGLSFKSGGKILGYKPAMGQGEFLSDITSVVGKPTEGYKPHPTAPNQFIFQTVTSLSNNTYVDATEFRFESMSVRGQIQVSATYYLGCGGAPRRGDYKIEGKALTPGYSLDALNSEGKNIQF